MPLQTQHIVPSESEHCIPPGGLSGLFPQLAPSPLALHSPLEPGPQVILLKIKIGMPIRSYREPPSFGSSRMSRFQKYYLFSISALALIYLLGFVLFDYHKNWVHPEISELYLENVIQNGRSLQWSDATRGLDFKLFDDIASPRSRFLSNYLMILNVKFRLWLFQWVPPHPSFSLMWVLTLFITPFFLFRLARNLSEKNETGWMAVLFYLLSTGALSVTTFQFHPGKGLAHFVLVFTLYLASELNKNLETAKKISSWFLLSFVLFVGCFADETAWFAVAATPLLFPGLFWEGRWRIHWTRALVFGSSFFAFLIFITYVAPWVISSLGYGNFSFWSYAVHSNRNLTEFFSGLDFFRNALNLGRDNFHLKHSGIFGLAFGVILLGWLLFSSVTNSSLRKTILKIALLLAAFVVFQTLLMTRHMQVVGSCYYYGSIVSLLFSLFFAVCLSVPGRKREIVNMGALAALLFISLSNYNHETDYWTDNHHIPSLSFEEVKDLWKNRRDPTYLSERQAQLPKRALWPFTEIREIP